jgi:diacylglycerol kinase family enzyme
MMPSAVLIANPSASQFTGGIFRQIQTTLSRSYELETQWPISPRDTQATTRNAVKDRKDVVFAMGGDGVAHHVANGLVHSDTALGIIPVGTTNVLSRILGIPQKPAKAAEAAIAYTPRRTRMLRVDAATDVGDVTRFATFSLGIGFDADVVEVAETRPYAKQRFGGLHYARTAATRLVGEWRNQKPNLRITCDKDRFDAVVALTQVHDPYTYFGRMPLRLTPEPPDGIATLAANDLGLTRASEIFLRAAVGRSHRDATGIKLWSAYQQLTVEAEPLAPFQADGETLGQASYLKVQPVEDAIAVLRP